MKIPTADRRIKIRVRGELNGITILIAHFVAVIRYFIIQVIIFFDIHVIFHLDGNTCKRRGRQTTYVSKLLLIVLITPVLPWRDPRG